MDSSARENLKMMLCQSNPIFEAPMKGTLVIDLNDNSRHCPEDGCGKLLVGIRNEPDETVYGCPEHGWQATIFEEGSGG